MQARGEQVFVAPNDAPTITRYLPDENDELRAVETLSFAGLGVTSARGYALINDNKAYLFDYETYKVHGWDPADMTLNGIEIGEIVELLRFQLTCERRKVALGEGDNSLGNRVPGLFVAQGLVEVEVYVNDTTTAVFPPYHAREQRSFAEDVRDRVARPLQRERGRHSAALPRGRRHRARLRCPRSE